MWEIVGTDEFAAWYHGLSSDQSDAVDAAVGTLEAKGPALGRPFVDTLHASRHANMKELRPRGGNLRILFAFDPRRTAVLLLGGDKTGRWKEWYEEAIPVADELYDAYLARLAKEGVI
jgi:hypothetical protein